VRVAASARPAVWAQRFLLQVRWRLRLRIQALGAMRCYAHSYACRRSLPWHCRLQLLRDALGSAAGGVRELERGPALEALLAALDVGTVAAAAEAALQRPGGSGGSGGTAIKKNRESLRLGFRVGEIAHGAVSRRPRISLDTMVPRTAGYAHDVGVWDRFVHRSRSSFCRAVPNPSVTMRNVRVAVGGATAAAVLRALRRRGAAGSEAVAAVAARLTRASVEALSDAGLLAVMRLMQRLAADGGGATPQPAPPHAAPRRCSRFPGWAPTQALLQRIRLA
jgi:hypothetical protein